MIAVVSAERIRAALDVREALRAIEEGFKAYSLGKAVVSPVGYLRFERPPGDCHIKAGYVLEDDVFVVKVATGFYENSSRGLPPGNGFMAVISARTGEPQALLDDGGYLTDVRTAIAGLIAAKYLAPQPPTCIGIVGTGTQARLQLELLSGHYGHCPVRVWGRDKTKAAAFAAEAVARGHGAIPTEAIRDLCRECDLIVTATASTVPLISSEWIRPGTHITAVGADAVGKQELHPSVFGKAHIRVVDSLEQCVDHGDAAHAVKAHAIVPADLIELGSIIAGTHTGRSGPEQITVADLTGLAVQDVQIAKCVWQKLRSSVAGRSGIDPG